MLHLCFAVLCNNYLLLVLSLRTADIAVRFPPYFRFVNVRLQKRTALRTLIRNFHVISVLSMPNAAAGRRDISLSNRFCTFPYIGKDFAVPRRMSSACQLNSGIPCNGTTIKQPNTHFRFFNNLMHTCIS